MKQSLLVLVETGVTGVGRLGICLQSLLASVDFPLAAIVINTLLYDANQQYSDFFP